MRGARCLPTCRARWGQARWPRRIAVMPSLVQAARLLRTIHDATEAVAAQWTTGWRAPVQAPVEVICHGDFAPYNCVFVDDKLVGVFDFDFAHAGPRVWDIAYALYRFVPMADPAQTEGFGSPDAQARRMRLFCDALRPARPLRGVRERYAANPVHGRFSAGGSGAWDARRIANIEAGHLRVYQHDLAYVRRHRALYEAALA
jgi:aminoglycoside phosphotransferase (APT) family kinase protein